MGPEQINALLGHIEGENLEFKEAKNRFSFDELARYCAALANEGGGKIILGVTDARPRKVVGTKAFEQLERTRAGLMRDWGYAPEYVEAMWMMLQQDKPEDFVIATSGTHSIQEFVEAAFAHAGLDWRKHVKIDPRYFRPAEVDQLLGDYSKAERMLGWKPRVKFKDLVRIMVDADIAAVQNEPPRTPADGIVFKSAQ